MSAIIEGGYADVRGVQTYFERCGNGQPIVFLHTAGRECRQYHWLMRELASDFTAVTFDYPGHGKSWPLAGDRAIEDPEEFCHFVWEFVEGLKLRRPIISGCSLGGNLSLMLGAKHSGDLLAIVPMQGADYTPSISQTQLELIGHPHVSLPFFNMDQSISLLGRKAPEEARAFIGWNTFHLSPKTLAADLRAYTSIDVRDQMVRVTCPVLMIWGEDDWIVSGDMVEATVRRLVNAARVEMCRLPGVGHFAPVEAPREIAEAIRLFTATIRDVKKSSQ